MKLSLSFFNTKKIPIILLMVSILFIKIPPFYLFGLNNLFFMTHNISRICIIFTAFATLLVKRNKLQFTVANILIMLFFIFQSTSILFAKDIVSFLSVYKDVAISLLLYFLALRIISPQHKKIILLTFFFATAVDLIFE